MREDSLHSITNFLAGVREKLSPIIDGQIKRGHACRAMGDLTLEPGLRKTTLADARNIAKGIRDKMNLAINALCEMDKRIDNPASVIEKCSCGLPMLLDEQYVTFRTGSAPGRTLSLKLRAQWCSRCDVESIAILHGKTARIP